LRISTNAHEVAAMKKWGSSPESVGVKRGCLMLVRAGA
jgi:hypothetical protein